jgi:hypothetical protein
MKGKLESKKKKKKKGYRRDIFALGVGLTKIW